MALARADTVLTPCQHRADAVPTQVFKDRDRYVSGDWRFRNGYCRHNPRKMVRTWAEKEMRNLARLVDAGLPAPPPVVLRNHVLVMRFIGTKGVPAPRLKVRALQPPPSDSWIRRPHNLILSYLISLGGGERQKCETTHWA